MNTCQAWVGTCLYTYMYYTGARLQYRSDVDELRDVTRVRLDVNVETDSREGTHGYVTYSISRSGMWHSKWLECV